MSKTTLHCQRIPGWVPGLLSSLGAGWVKLVNPPAGEDPFLGLNKDVRIWTDDWDRELIAQGVAGADDYMARMLPLWAPYRGWARVAFELPNEPPVASNEELAHLNAFTERCITIGNANGLRLIVLNISEGSPGDNGTGDPNVTKWKVQQLTPCVKAAVAGGHLVGLHGYGRPDVEDLTGRYHALRCIETVKTWQEAGVDIGRLRVALTEFGIDGGIAGNPPIHGWHDLMSQADYVAQVVEGEVALRALPWLEFAALFTAGAEMPWPSYEQDEQTVRLIASGIASLQSGPAITSVPTVRLWHRDTGAVEVLPVEDYLRGVVPAESYASWPAECLKAQAVAARTYTVAAIAHPRHSGHGADLCSKTCCQAWATRTDARTDAAIAATAGETWGSDGSYVAYCGRTDCIRCQGANGTNGDTFVTRLCQWGARDMAALGATYRQILRHYLGAMEADGAGADVPTSYPVVAAYASDGSVTTVAALQAVYAFTVKRAPVAAGAPVYRLTAIRERFGDSCEIGRVRGADSTAVAGLYLGWYWPGGSQADEPAQWITGQWETNYQLAGPTDANGEAAPGMGMGAYHAIGQPGPHAMWVADAAAPSDAVYGLGMITQTAHDHINLEWSLVTAGGGGDGTEPRVFVPLVRGRWGGHRGATYRVAIRSLVCSGAGTGDTECGRLSPRRRP